MIPLILLGGAALTTGGALAYDWLKSSTKNPEVVITNANVNPTTESSFLSLKNVLLYGGAGVGAYFIYKKMRK